MKKLAMLEGELISSYMKEKDTIRDVTVAILRLMMFGESLADWFSNPFIKLNCHFD